MWRVWLKKDPEASNPEQASFHRIVSCTMSTGHCSHAAQMIACEPQSIENASEKPDDDMSDENSQTSGGADYTSDSTESVAAMCEPEHHEKGADAHYHVHSDKFLFRNYHYHIVNKNKTRNVYVHHHHHTHHYHFPGGVVQQQVDRRDRGGSLPAAEGHLTIKSPSEPEPQVQSQSGSSSSGLEGESEGSAKRARQSDQGRDVLRRQNAAFFGDGEGLSSTEGGVSENMVSK